MILPTKRIHQTMSLVYIGGELLAEIRPPMTVSELWTKFVDRRKRTREICVTYDWFVLALDLLFLMGAIEFRGDRLEVVAP